MFSDVRYVLLKHYSVADSKASPLIGEPHFQDGVVGVLSPPGDGPIVRVTILQTSSEVLRFSLLDCMAWIFHQRLSAQHA